MKKLILVLLFLSSHVFSCDGPYLKIGAGYKFQETDHFHNVETGGRTNIHFSDPVSARIELGIEKGNLSYGVSHHSQWRTGFPFNNEDEIQKTEVFIDYKFNL